MLSLGALDAGGCFVGCGVSGSSLVRAWLMAGSNPIALVESTVNAWLALKKNRSSSSFALIFLIPSLILNLMMTYPSSFLDSSSICTVLNLSLVE